MLAVIPYETFPTIELGPLTLRTFGLFVALGVLVGAWVAASYAERFGISRDETYRVATWMVLAGIIGSRLTWAATHTDAIDSPLDVIAIWQGGIQFAGGFIAAVLVGLPFFRRWSRLQRWRVLDGYSFGLAIGLALGRVGCYSVGEHFGRRSDFLLATRFDGGEVREPLLGDVPLQVGMSFHNTALYELIYLLVLFAGLGALVWRTRRRGGEVAPGTLVGVFLVYYGIARLLSDSLRVNDERVAGLTGAQWMCVVMIPSGLWILAKVRPRVAVLAAAEAAAEPETGAEAEVETEADADTPAEPGSVVAAHAGAETDAEVGADADETGAEPAPVAVDDAADAELGAEGDETGAEPAPVAVGDGAEPDAADAGEEPEVHVAATDNGKQLEVEAVGAEAAQAEADAEGQAADEPEVAADEAEPEPEVAGAEPEPEPEREVAADASRDEPEPVAETEPVAEAEPEVAVAVDETEPEREAQPASVVEVEPVAEADGDGDGDREAAGQRAGGAE
ncbi:MAG TPA: prolipoprotein diacylglyceryl transferase family protein, partial [Acidimicrobiales bacterium]